VNDDDEHEDEQNRGQDDDGVESIEATHRTPYGARQSAQWVALKSKARSMDACQMA
jgi:hypothetical protein